MVHVPYPPPVPGLDVAHADVRRRAAVFAVKGPYRAIPAARAVAQGAGALTIVEGGVAFGWIAAPWPGLVPELCRVLPDLEIVDPELDGPAMLDRAGRARARTAAVPSPLGPPPLAFRRAADRRHHPPMCGRMPWTTRRKALLGPCRCPSGETAASATRTCRRRAGRRTRNRVRADQRAASPTRVELWTDVPRRSRRGAGAKQPPIPGRHPVAADVRRWFEEHTHR